MRSGWFFELNKKATASPKEDSFSYRRIRRQSNVFYPVTVEINDKKIRFIYSSEDKGNIILLFEFSFSGRAKKQNQLQLEKIAQPSKVRLFPTQRIYEIKYELIPFDVDDYFNLPYFYGYGHSQNRDLCYICMRNLFLDFLWDLYHSYVFENSPYVNQIYLLVEKNFLLKSIQAKAEFFWREKALNVQPNSITYQLAIQAAIAWSNQLKSLTKAQKGTLKSSMWFGYDIDREIQFIESFCFYVHFEIQGLGEHEDRVRLLNQLSELKVILDVLTKKSGKMAKELHSTSREKPEEMLKVLEKKRKNYVKELNILVDKLGEFRVELAKKAGGSSAFELKTEIKETEEKILEVNKKIEENSSEFNRWRGK